MARSFTNNPLIWLALIMGIGALVNVERARSQQLNTGVFWDLFRKEQNQKRFPMAGIWMRPETDEMVWETDYDVIGPEKRTGACRGFGCARDSRTKKFLPRAFNFARQYHDFHVPEHAAELVYAKSDAVPADGNRPSMK